MPNVIGRSIEACMPTEAPVYRVTDVDWERWAAEGVRAVRHDYEGTFGETGSSEPDPELVVAIEEARAAGIPHHALGSNMAIRTRKDLEMVRGWEEGTGVDYVVTAQEPWMAKPGPVLDYAVMEHFKVGPQAMGATGDKATADVQAARSAGIGHIAWTRPFGANRHVGDRVIRDPAENLLRVIAHYRYTPQLRDRAQLLSLKDGELLRPDFLDLEAVTMGDPEFAGQDKIAGFGLPEIDLDDELLAQLRQPLFRQGLQEVADIKNRYDESAAAEVIRQFLYEHGRTVANVLTFSRLGIAAGMVAVNMSQLDPEAKKKINITLEALQLATDLFDGPASRAHKDGATVKGGQDDQNIDKVIELVTDLFVLLPNGAISPLLVLASGGRNASMTAIRQPFRDRGMDTKSVFSGKVAAAYKGGAQIFGTLLGDRYPALNRKVQIGAVALKLGSAVHGPLVWTRNYEYHQHLLINARRHSSESVLETNE